MRRLAFAALFLLAGSTADSAPRFPSPSGKYLVSFETPGPVYEPDPSRENPLDRAVQRKYRAAFYLPGQNTVVAITDFYDVRGSRAEEPAPPAQLASEILWSPGEDFVVLPRERWDLAPQRVRETLPKARLRRQAVSLNRAFPWQTAIFDFEEGPLVWVDSLRVSGTQIDGCRMTAALFSGKEGKMSLLAEASAPAGYQVIKQEGGKLYIKKVAGPCATAEDQAKIASDCMILDMAFMRKEIGRCPE